MVRARAPAGAGAGPQLFAAARRDVDGSAADAELTLGARWLGATSVVSLAKQQPMLNQLRKLCIVYS